MRSTKIIKICSSSLWTCLHHMVLLRTQNKITDFFMILPWASPFNMNIIKSTIKSISKPLVSICNLSLSSGIFPDDMKIPRVIPLYKAGKKDLFTNYRPVSLLPQFSKILEKIYNSRLDKFVSKHDILSNSQYGFRQNMSTNLALLELVE